MEFTVGHTRVLLTTHKSYGDADALDSLRAFAQYPPLCGYLNECAQGGSIPDTVVVRRLDRVADRITGAVVDLVYGKAPGGTATTTTVLRLADADPAVLLPIVTLEGQRYAVLAQQVELSQGLVNTKTAIRGVVTREGGFASDKYASALAGVGIRVADAAPLSPKAFTVGNEGELAIRFFTLAAACNAHQVEELRHTPSLALVPLADVIAAGDAAASLAVSLISATA
ncbi:hypothetical protein JKF63_06642 [Porcisia hertigi]|uniref:Uncharacterized protein n=1 Tax=Porcisia hertigi TaxID=2761500 RepID=A0A836IS22_9TRYP|nr:hypothetical protein JKF63_06642 [Porcisia hertigi]